MYMTWNCKLECTNDPMLNRTNQPRLPSYGVYISQLVRFDRCCTTVLDFHSKNLQITSKTLTQPHRVTNMTSLKHFESSSCHTLSLYPNFVKYGFKNLFLKEFLTGSSTAIF